MAHHVTTDRLVIRPFEARDMPCVLDMLNDFSVSKWLATVPYPYTKGDLERFLHGAADRWPDVAAITLNGELIGGISSGAHVGYWIGRPHWGQGFGTEAAAAMVAHSFERTPRKVIKSGYFTANIASARILHGLGFREVSRNMKPCAARDADVAHVNVILTRDRWEAMA